MSCRSRKSMSQINVVPFIDVMLVLLIIFMVTAPLLVRNVDVELPVSKGDPTQVAEILPPVVVGVDEQGLYFLYNDDGVREYVESREAAIARAAAVYALDADAGTEREIMVYGDKRVEYQKVLDLLSLLSPYVREGDSVKLMTVLGE
ncbi:biopolymer transporter ExbD [Solemya velum gill symbiont]|uniref:biopolymer transporter ExbD n=1 Tax=Solemya velum gill symbiont TaxID=2340 RepID=UPI000997609C|nr:biopolymer transporter ExbD [Solemya velum gill symbiont]OOY99604.1 hypothetical protein BOW19_03415 [Solemya velum gill symbiont]OOZ01785.1 hypothetical protein BOW20_03410 [Solemya velum gill symbiont]OOZ04125.1 hypothetical protein BOW21_03420 [Solemya velum gill symbiont]OOZ06367.1 hypothetical protein BOW22_03405 [Solemya velum gill symbiont]OOZ08629.1 hypothetical protein BOW23_03805 [Solemya velum gill symbiont]